MQHALPDTRPESLCDLAIKFHERDDLIQAERLYRQALAAMPAPPSSVRYMAGHMLGILKYQQGHLEEAAGLMGDALRIGPGSFEVFSIYADILRAMGRYEDAIDAFGQALALNPTNAGAFSNQGISLAQLRRLEEALACFDKAIGLNPGMAEAWSNRGVTLRSLKRHADALASFDRALALDPANAKGWNGRGGALHSLMRFAEAENSIRRALEISPDLPEALRALGELLCESGRAGEGLAIFARHAALTKHGADASGMPHKIRHDEEQQAYLKGKDGSGMADGARIHGPAINPANTGGDIAARWRAGTPQLLVIDDFLTPEALQKLRAFCLDSTIWRRVYEEGYLGAIPEHGFTAPLLAQIAEELQTGYPAVFAGHPLCYLWAFKYDSALRGTPIHADAAAVNVNFWITPDEANLDPDTGGMVIWDVKAPHDWDFHRYNADPKASQNFVDSMAAKPRTIAYRANRAVIFDSDLFHRTDNIRFRDGYANRRINVTFLYGRRVQNGG